MFVYHVHVWCLEKSEEALDTMKLDLQTIVRYCVGARNQQVLFSADWCL